MNKCTKAVSLLFLVLVLATQGVFAQSDKQRAYKHRVLQDPELLKLSTEYSNKVVAQNPEIKKLLERLGLKYLHELDPTKTYSFNEKTQAVSIEAIGIGFLGFGSATAEISSPGSDILGKARTIVTCPFGAQTATVSGFMASTVSRDPVGGIRNGTLVIDNFLDSVAEVNFRILKVPPGAKNPMNRTTMESTHMGTCGGDVKVVNLIATWPPLRVDFAIDDTGSMSEELGGVQSALASFVATQNTDPDKVLREISYELISFKDSPTLRLANTSDTTAVINAINTLSASGGADCPEDSFGALNLALDRLTGDTESEGQIVLVTDASPGGNGDPSALISRAQSLGIKVNVMLSGDCVESSAATTASTAVSIPSARDVFKRIADETGGLFFFLPNGTEEEYSQILAQIFEAAVSGSDTTPPVVTVKATPEILWPVNHKMVRIGVEVSATDDKDPNPIIKLVGVTVNEPDNGQGDGNTHGDVQITEAGEIYLRAERSGSGKGRFYTITYQATDKNGNVGFGTIDVKVPHNK